MIVFERYYEDNQASVKYSRKTVSTRKALAVELIAIPGKIDMIPDRMGYYFRGDFLVLFDRFDKVVEVLPQVHGKFAKNNSQSSGWYWYWHEGSLKSMSVFIERLDGYKPISTEHYNLLKDCIHKVELLEGKCIK